MGYSKNLELEQERMIPSEEEVTSYFDEDAVNDIVLEDRKQLREERVEKNHILSMSNEDRKREEWKKHFPHIEMGDDSYLLNGEIY